MVFNLRLVGRKGCSPLWAPKRSKLSNIIDVINLITPLIAQEQQRCHDEPWVHLWFAIMGAINPRGTVTPDPVGMVKWRHFFLFFCHYFILLFLHG